MKNLIIRPHGIGDVVMLIPALQSLVKNNPEEEFTFLTHKGFGQILPSELNINIIEYSRHANFSESLRLIKRIRKEGFQRLFDLFCNPRTAQISLLSGIKERYGFPCRFRSFVYNHKYKNPTPKGEHIHQADLYCNFFNSFGLKCEYSKPDVKCQAEIVSKAREAIPEKYRNAKPLIALNVNATYPSKAWPIENAVKFIELWHEKTNQPVMLTWGPGEEAPPKEVLAKVSDQKAFLHKPVKIKEFIALMSLIDLLVTNDAGPAHMAWEVNTGTVTLFGPTTEQDVEPRGEKHITIRAEGIECARCHKEHCHHKKCMYAITPESVLAAVMKLLTR